MTWWQRSVLAAGLVLLAGAGAAGAADDEKKTTKPAPAAESSAPPLPPVYVPPSRGAKKVRVGAGTRGAAGSAAHFVLAPDHIAVTTEAQPTLYWFTEGALSARVEFTLLGEGEVAPRAEIALAGPIAAGFHAISLAEHSLSLEPGLPYRWFVAQIPDSERRASDLLSGGIIERREPDAALASELAATGADGAWAVYARHGVWHDAIDALQRRIAADPSNAELLAARTRLLADGGLPAPAP